MAGTKRKRPSIQLRSDSRPSWQRRRSPKRRIGRWLLIWTGVIAVWGLVALGGLVAYYAYDLPDVAQIAAANRAPSVTLLAADGSVLANYGQLYGEAVDVGDLPPHVPQAVIAVEDRRFYSHNGVDVFGLARAMLANIRAGRIVQGGSTITQQLAKNLFLKPDRTLRRKVREVLLAFWLERKFSKDQIMTLYLNRVYFGAGTYGVDAAARRYFGKSAREMTIYEGAVLAGLLKAPSRFNPTRNLDAAEGRAQLVLQAMVETGFIGEAEAIAALTKKTNLASIAGSGTRYFADWILNEVRSYVGYSDRDLIVQTTLDLPLQKAAQEEVAKTLEQEGEGREAGQAAMVVMTPDGSVRAMVGGRDYGESQFNRATQALRQPGSAFKLFVYLASFENGLHPDRRFVDGPIKIGRWAPKNYADRYYGDVTMREAFARSLNSVAVQVSQATGPETVADAARRLGVTSDLDPQPSLALGTSEVSLLELTTAYAVFANRGFGVWPHGIKEIRDSTGRVVYKRVSSGAGQLVRARQVDQMNDLLRATVEWGTGKGAKFEWPAAGKTGTSQGFRDAWFVGFTASMIAGVWVGNDDGAPMKGVTGGGLPARLWARVMRRALKDKEPEPLPIGEIAQARSPEKKPSGGNFIKRILSDLIDGPDEPEEEEPVKRRRFFGRD
ncbi:MAG: PBP1A family penicillin-binding protein [Kiloniellales bacterium]|nr:PBP1A family penicillin-binding protein [Kiloniellales bacterium]